MCNYESSLKILTTKLKLKDSYLQIRNFCNKNKKQDNFIFLQKSYESMYNLSQETFLLQLNDGISYETYFFNIVSDKSGYYIYDKNEIRHFRKKENALKYKLSKLYLKNFKYSNSIEYFCFNCNIINKDKYESANDAFMYNRRIYI